MGLSGQNLVPRNPLCENGTVSFELQRFRIQTWIHILTNIRQIEEVLYDASSKRTNCGELPGSNEPGRDVNELRPSTLLDSVFNFDACSSSRGMELYI